jgi:type IV secretion system protein VirD4
VTFLPRGQFSSQTPGAPLATARWGSFSEIERHHYKTGDIYLGAIKGPHTSSLEIINLIDQVLSEITQDRAIHDSWKRTVSEQLNSFRSALNCTTRIPLGISDDRHQVTVATTRSGKGTTLIVPNLALYPGSLFAIDPKGTNATLTASRRGKGSGRCKGLGQKTYVLDPYRVSKIDPSLHATFNPLDALNVEDDMVIDKASSIADAIVVKTEGSGDLRHFDETARILNKGLILFVKVRAKPENQTLPYVYRLLNTGVRGTEFEDKGLGLLPKGDPFRMLLKLMEEEKAFDGVIAGIAATLLDMGDREYGSVLSTARRHLEFLERPAMRRSLAASSFNFDELKDDPNGVSIFLCLPVTRMFDTGRWLRLLVACALDSIYKEPGPAKSGHPVLMLLEEFAALGHMQTIETAAGYAAEYGLKLWCILQDLPQLKRHYPNSWETFLANSSVIQAFGVGDNSTLDYLSKKAGETEIIQTNRSGTTSVSVSSQDVGDFNLANSLTQNRGALSFIAPAMLTLDRESKGQSTSTTVSEATQSQKSALILPDEIERGFARENMTQLLCLKGERPFLLERESYFNSP